VNNSANLYIFNDKEFRRRQSEFSMNSIQLGDEYVDINPLLIDSEFCILL
jgi:hypothetical protein